MPELIKETTMPIKTGVFIESVDMSEATIDAENRVIRGVVLIRAGMSKNRRYYSEDVLRKAAPAFNEAKAYANHPSKTDSKDRPERSIRDITGFYKDVVYENGLLKADRYFTRNQAGQDAFVIAEDIVNKRAPASLAGLSINAVGTGKVDKFEDGEALRVESITTAVSVDDITNAAAGGSYMLTASSNDEIMTGIIESLSYQEWQEARPDFVEKFKAANKAVRLEDETKNQIAEADRKVKVANDSLVEAQTALTEAQNETNALSTANEKLMSECTALKIQIAVFEALDGVELPALYLKDLRESLPKLAPGEWVARIQTEQSKAKRANGVPKVPVTNAGLQEAAEAPRSTVSTSLEPLPDENIKDWQERLARLNHRK